MSFQLFCEILLFLQIQKDPKGHTLITVEGYEASKENGSCHILDLSVLLI